MSTHAPDSSKPRPVDVRRPRLLADNLGAKFEFSRQNLEQVDVHAPQRLGRGVEGDVGRHPEHGDVEALAEELSLPEAATGCT